MVLGPTAATATEKGDSRAESLRADTARTPMNRSVRMILVGQKGGAGGALNRLFLECEWKASYARI